MEARGRVHVPPDQIINGKPKWTDISIIRKTGKNSMDDENIDFSIDRLNPSRHLVDEIETSCEEKAEDTQKVLYNMMSDLKCELVVTLGDAKLNPEKEKALIEKFNEWEIYKKENGIKEWKPKRKQTVKWWKKDIQVKPCRVMLKKIKVEEKKEGESDRLTWNKFLGDRKRTFSDVENEKSSKKKGIKRRKSELSDKENEKSSKKKGIRKRKSEFVKMNSLLNWIAGNTNPNVTL